MSEEKEYQNGVYEREVYSAPDEQKSQYQSQESWENSDMNQQYNTYQQPNQQQQYGQYQQYTANPQYQQYQPRQQEAKGMSIASMVLGIISLVLFCIWYLSIPLAIVGLVLGILGRKKGGKGMATAGIICSIIALVLTVVFVGIFIAAFSQFTWDMMTIPSEQYTY